jgi:hypothetical protein
VVGVRSCASDDWLWKLPRATSRRLRGRHAYLPGHNPANLTAAQAGRSPRRQALDVTIRPGTGRNAKGRRAPPSCRRQAEGPACQGRWSMARAPVTGWTDFRQRTRADAEQRIRFAHRAIEIREKRRRVLSSRPARVLVASSPGLVASSPGLFVARHPAPGVNHSKPRVQRGPGSPGDHPGGRNKAVTCPTIPSPALDRSSRGADPPAILAVGLAGGSTDIRSISSQCAGEVPMASVRRARRTAVSGLSAAPARGPTGSEVTFDSQHEDLCPYGRAGGGS